MKVHASTGLLICLLIVTNSPSARCQQAEPLGGQAVQSASPKVEPKTGGNQKEMALPEQKALAAQGTSATAGAVEQVPRRLQVLKTVTETLAYVLAFIFFLYKSYEGYLTTNLSLTLKCKRVPVTEAGGKTGKDYLAVTATIKKGRNGLMKLLQAEVRTTALNSGLVQKQTLDVRRLDYDRSRVLKGEEDAISWNQAKKGWPFMQFPPGDSSHFACNFLVPSEEPCRVDVVVMGRGRWPKIKTSQWRVSDISLSG